LAKKITSIVGRDLPIELDPKRLRPEKSEVDRLCADSSLAKHLIGWEPQVSLDEGLTQTVEWIQRQLHELPQEDYVL
jgi:nucleoside-diphosphate-sugar epimerase